MKNFILLLILLPVIILAQIPQTMNYQGRLEDNSGNPVTDGNYSLIFTIYDAATNGTSLWTETRTVTTEDGFFNLTLGENTAINISTDQQIWLNVNIGGNDLTPRTKLSGSLSSLSTKSVENTATAGNSVVTSINTSTGGVDATKIADGSVSNTEFQLLDGATSTLVGVSDTQTLTNKTIDADNNTITNIGDSNIPASAGIDASKLADGSVSNTEYQRLSGVTSDIQTQLESKQASLPAQTGNSGKFLSTDGTNLSWEASSGGGSVAEVIELTLSAKDTIKTTTYQNITNTQPTLAANAVYLVKGMLGANRITSSTNINIRLNYGGTASMILFEVRDKNSDTDGLLTNYPLTGPITEHIFDGVIKTTTSDTFSIQAAKNTGTNTDSEISTATKFLLIRVK